jgi:flavin reductase (DIM6/NTAB) family NADH-FMN oxidoreductase RutF
MTDPQTATPLSAAALDPRQFRSTIGLFATGVTVIAAGHTQAGEARHIHALTANSVTSLSLDPPLLLFGLGRHTRMVPELREAGTFVVNILREGQQPLSNYFAGRWPDAPPPPFRFEPWEGGPRLAGCLAALACRVEAWLDGGDHWIVIGRVLALHRGDEPLRPLLFYAGAYRRLDPEAEPAPDLEEDSPPVQIFYDPW